MNREATTHEWRYRPSFQPPMSANNLMAKEGKLITGETLLIAGGLR
jgi:hypothetical protein